MESIHIRGRYTTHIVAPQQQTTTQPTKDLNVINLSSHILSEEEKLVLKKGLNFCPTHNLDKFELYKDLQLFVRKIILKKLYHKQSANPDRTTQENQALDQLISLLEESDTADLIDSIDLPWILQSIEEQDSYSKTNPSKSLLKKKSDICPPPSTSPNAAAFLKLVNKDLEKLKIKTKGPINLSKKKYDALNSLANNKQITIKPSDKGRNVVLLNIDDYLNICKKILNNASKLVDEFLRPYATSLPSHVSHLLQILEECNIPDQALLVTIDVETLYSSIPHERDLAAIKHILQQNTTTDPVYNEFILSLLEYILT